MRGERQQLEAAIDALEARREALGDAVVEALLGPARARLAALAEAPVAETGQALRQVSILFLDVVGSTALSRTLDPEAISAVLDDLLARGTAIVRTHRGSVLQYAGDNILAVFGADEAREDDAECAVRCGLALLRLGRALGAEVRQSHGLEGFDVRVGIHSGGVLLGGGVADGSIRGMAVNIAARMEQTAPPGGLRISQDTHALVRGAFEVEPQPPLQVKGMDEPVPTWLVRRPAPRAWRAAGRGVDGLPTRMVGREAELQALHEALERVTLQGRLQAVTVRAEAGLGKSRLLQEFERALDDAGAGVLRLRSRCTPASAMQPWGVLRELLAGDWGLRDDDTLPQAQARVAAGVVPLLEADDGAEAAQVHAHLLGHLLGIDHGASPHIAGIRNDVGQIRTRAWHAALQWFRRRAARAGRPLLLLAEDLHWADEGSLDFLAELVRRLADVPVLLVALARPTLHERRPGWPGGDGATTLELRALDPEASDRLLGELLQRLDAAPAGLAARLAGMAEGNPFYLEELVRMLLDQGAIRTDGPLGRWHVDPARLQTARLPPTLTGVLQARLDTLPPAERLALQQASVIGPRFWAQALAALDPRAEAALPALQRKALTVPRGEADDGLREHAFAHQLLHQVTYGTVLQRTRRALHAGVAQWLSGRGGARAGDFLALTAEHFERAGDAPRALAHHLRAAAHARERFAHDAVLHHADRALALMPQVADDEAPARRWDLHSLRARSHGDLGRQAEEAQALDDLDAASAEVDDARRAYACLLRAESCARRGDAAAMERLAERGRVLAEQAGHVEHGLRALFLTSSARLMAADLDGCEALARRGLEQARAHGAGLLVAAFLNELAMVTSYRGDLPRSLALTGVAVEAAARIGDRRNEAGLRLNLGVFLHQLGRFERARADLEQALKVATAVGSAVHQAACRIELAAVRLSLGEVDAARALARAGADGAAGAPVQACSALATLGDVELAVGRWDEAAAAYERSHDLAQAMDSADRFRAVGGLAEVALARGDGAEALARARAIAALDDATLEATGFRRQLEWTCHRVEAAVGDAAAAWRWLAQAHAGLLAQHGRIDDPALARDFLERPALHAAIVAAWRGTPAPTAAPVAGTPATPPAPAARPRPGTPRPGRRRHRPAVPPRAGRRSAPRRRRW